MTLAAAAKSDSLSPERTLPGLWRLAWPLFISLALSLSLNFTDAFFLSRISDTAAAAAGAINPLLGATVVLFSSIAQAGASVAARLMGARRHDELPLSYFAMFLFNLVVGVCISALLFLLHPYVPGWLGLSGETAQFAQTYLAVMGGFQFVKAVQLAYGNMLNARGETRWVLVEAVATNVANIGLNLAVSKHMWNLPAPSVRVVASVTVLAMAFGMVFTICVVHVLFRVRFPLRVSLAQLRESLRPILRIGLPSASEPISYQCAQITINVLIISFGATALAARTYVMSFITISSVLWSIALGMATQIAIAHRIGAGRHGDANRELHRALVYGLSGNATFALLLAAFHRPLLSLLTHDEKVHAAAAPLFMMCICVELGRAVNIVVGGALRSSGDASFVAIVGSSMMWTIGVGTAYFLGGTLQLGLLGIWIAMAIDETTRGVVNYRRWRTGRWRDLSALPPASAAGERMLTLTD
jgi:putative MATE family efflux protein